MRDSLLEAMHMIYKPMNRINKTAMLISLYFKEEIQKELYSYSKQRKLIIGRIIELQQANSDSMYEDNKQFFIDIDDARFSIHQALEKQMKKLNENLTRKK